MPGTVIIASSGCLSLTILLFSRTRGSAPSEKIAAFLVQKILPLVFLKKNKSKRKKCLCYKTQTYFTDELNKGECCRRRMRRIRWVDKGGMHIAIRRGSPKEDNAVNDDSILVGE